jgi:hypothetical protein
MRTRDMGRQISMLRYRMAQVSDLQRQRKELNALKGSAEEPLDLAMQIARVESALRIARLVMAQLLHSLPESERRELIQTHARSRHDGQVASQPD